MTVADVRWEMLACFAAICSPGRTRKGKHRPFPVGVFQLLHGIPQARPSRHSPQNVHPSSFWHFVLSRLEGKTHNTCHLGRFSARLNRIFPQSGPRSAQGHPENCA